MNPNKLLLSAMLLISTTGYAAALDRDGATYAEVKRFWMMQLDGGESAVIEKVKACYALQTEMPKKSIQEAEECIIWDVALAGMSFGVSTALSEKTGKPAESLQTPFTRQEYMKQRVMTLLRQYGIRGDAAASILRDIDNRVSIVFGSAHTDAAKYGDTSKNLDVGNSAIDLDKLAKEIDNANKPNAESQLALGTMYAEGKGIHQDYNMAVKYFSLSAEQGNAVAQYNLGISYGNGYGVQRDQAESLKWFRLAAEQGLISAQLVLGNVYGAGEIVQKDSVEAAKWMQLAAAQGNADAQNVMGSLHELGEGVLQDYIEANRWFRLAASQGHGLALFNLGRIYSNGIGVLQDDREASKWLLLAAEKGHAKAQLMLGLMYEIGKGVPKNLAVAHAMFNLSALGDPSPGNVAIRKRSSLNLEMSSRETMSAQALAIEMARPNNLIRALERYLETDSIKKKKSM